MQQPHNKLLSVNSRQRGFTILEVLVSLVVFSVALIGIAKLQVVSKQSSFDALARVTASLAVEDILSRMRSNATELDSYVGVNGATQVGNTTITTEPSPDCGSSASADQCNNIELALHDIWEFERNIDGYAELNITSGNVGGLPLPTACLSGPSDGSAGIYTVTVAWRGKNSLSNPASNTCGVTSGYYGTNNKYRRVVSISTYIDNQ